MRFNINKPIDISGSYVQDQKYATVSNKFNVVQAASVGQAMVSNGLNIVSLSTGRARHEDKKDFQRTLSRYRGPEIAPGVFLDVIYDSKHMGRGVDKILLGIYRMVCTNGLFIGTNFFKTEVRHSGNTYDQLNQGIALALGMQDKLTQVICKMQSKILSADETRELAEKALTLLIPDNATNVRHDLLKTRRQEDTDTSLWTVFNRVQENAMHGRAVYSLKQVNELTGIESTRQMSLRPIKPNSGRDADFNQKLFEIAEKIAA